MRRLPLGRGHDPAPGPCRCQHPSRHFSPLVRQFQGREWERTRPLKEVCPAWSDHGSLPDVCHHRGLGSIPGPMSTETFPIRHDIALTSNVTELDHLLAQLPCYGTGHRPKLNWLLLRTSLGHHRLITHQEFYFKGLHKPSCVDLPTDCDIVLCIPVLCPTGEDTDCSLGVTKRPLAANISG